MLRLPYAMLVVAVMVAVSLAGCALPPDTGEPGPVDSGDAALPPDEPATPAVPPAVEPDRARVGLGESATAGPWAFVVRAAEYGQEFGGLSASDGTLVRLDIDLANRSAADLAITPSDFTLAVGAASLLPLLGDDAFVPDTLVGAGASESVTVVYEVDVDPEEASLTLIFQPAEGDPVIVEVDIGE